MSLQSVRTGVFLKTPFYSYLNAVDRRQLRKKYPWVPSLCRLLEHLVYSFHFTRPPSLSLQRTGLLRSIGLEPELNLSALIDTVGRITTAVGSPVHPAVFSSIPSFYPLDASSSPLPGGTARMSPDIAKCPVGDITASSREALDQIDQM